MIINVFQYQYLKKILIFKKKEEVWNGGINLDMEKDVNLNMISTNSLGLKCIQNRQEMNFQNELWNVIFGSFFYVFTQMQLLKVSLGMSTIGATKPWCPTQRQKKPFCGSSILPTSRCDEF